MFASQTKLTASKTKNVKKNANNTKSTAMKHSFVDTKTVMTSYQYGTRLIKSAKDALKRRLCTTAAKNSVSNVQNKSLSGT